MSERKGNEINWTLLWVFKAVWSEVVKSFGRASGSVCVFSKSVCERMNKDCLPLEIQ